jgi:flagellar basal body P-ring formation protein FlgA
MNLSRHRAADWDQNGFGTTFAWLVVRIVIAGSSLAMTGLVAPTNRKPILMKHLILPLALLAAPLSAQQFEDVAALDAQVATVAEAAQPIDRRLKLARCPESVAIDPPTLGAVALRCKSLGWRIRVPLVQTTQAEAASEIIIRRGDGVEVISSGNGFEVSTSGTAMEDGSLGKGIRVKSSTGTATTLGTITSAGTVQINR